MKKIIAILLALLTTFSFVACQPSTPDTPDVPNTPDTPDVPVNPDTPNTPDVPNTPDTPDAPDTPAEPAGPQILDLTKDIKHVGRSYVDGNLLFFDWSGSGFEFNFYGTKATATFGTRKDESWGTEVTVFVDGERVNKFAISKTPAMYTLVEGLEKDKLHTVKVVKSSVSSNIAAYAYNIEVDYKLAEAPTKKDRQILALGDSLSTGRAVLGDNSASSSTPNINDSTYATPWLLADRFDADLELVADTGYGIFWNSSGNPDYVIPKVWNYISHATKQPYDFTQSDPDLILINLGTNDVFSSSPMSSFVTALTDFLKDVRAKYPNATILYYYGMIRHDRENVITTVIKQMQNAGDNNIYFLRLDSVKENSAIDKLGPYPMSHPCPAHYEYYANILEKEIKTIMGW